MIEKIKLLQCVIIMITISLTGCASIIFDKQHQPVYYTISYKPEQIPTNLPHKVNILIWNFSAAKPYDSTCMMVEENRCIKKSNIYYWISDPGTMLKDRLITDLETDNSVNIIYPEKTKNLSYFYLTGRIEKWAWVKSKSGKYYADLSVILKLWKKDSSEILFKKRYHLKTRPATSNTPEAFSTGMSSLVKKLSIQFRKDLYNILQQITFTHSS